MFLINFVGICLENWNTLEKEKKKFEQYRVVKKYQETEKCTASFYLMWNWRLFFGGKDFGQRKACLLKFVCEVKFD